MMDAMSEQLAPSKEEANRYIFNRLWSEFHDMGISEDDVRFIIDEEIDKFDSFGSLAAWYSITSSLLMKNCRISIKRKYQLKD